MKFEATFRQFTPTSKQTAAKLRVGEMLLLMMAKKAQENKRLSKDVKRATDNK